MINNVTIVGRLSRDLELRYTSNGKPVASGTIAVNRPFSNQQGEKDADFVSTVVRRKQAENAANFLSKGSLVGIDGRLQSRSYDNNEGKRVFILEVVADSVQFLEPKGSREDNQSTNQSKGSQQANTKPSDPFNDPFSDSTPIDINDDNLPF